MKKYVKGLVLILLLALTLCSVGCNAGPTEPIEQFDFHQYLESLHFVFGMSQSEFLDLMKTYTYDGKSIAEMNYYHYDMANGGCGCAGYGPFYDFCNDYAVSEDEQYVTYSNRINTRVKLGGMDLPNGIEFQDTVATVFRKLGAEEALARAFMEEEEATLTVWSDEGSSLQLINCKKATEAPRYDWILEYSESYEVTYESGRVSAVVRRVTMSFNGDGRLADFGVSVVETYERAEVAASLRAP